MSATRTIAMISQFVMIAGVTLIVADLTPYEATWRDGLAILLGGFILSVAGFLIYQRVNH